MTAPSVQLTLDAPVTECGDVVSGEVRWDAGAGVLRAVVVTLSFRTEGAGTPPDHGGPEPVEVDRGPDAKGRFEIPVPTNGPITFEGRSISVSWRVEARLDIPSARDTRVDEPVTVLPRGGLAVWARQQAAPPDAVPGEDGSE